MAQIAEPLQIILSLGDRPTVVKNREKDGGGLDFTDDVLDSFDYVVASVHSHFNQAQEEMTKRIVRAISNPRVTMRVNDPGPPSV